MPNHPNESAAIENLQRYLRQLSYHEPSITAPPIDGIFESDTRKSLREFQASRRLPVTGEADRQTWERLYAAYRASVAENAPPRQMSIFPFVRQTIEIQLGNSGFAVAAVQFMLRELGARYSGMEDLVVDGQYGKTTEDAVKDFQGRNVLPTNGRVGAVTWNAIADQYNTLFAGEPFL
ncbi:MAG: peptidoglycan-binding protein [Clostridia bacterium]|nr:peptidoglycan-binding protein [Clostridia bacterium]